MKKFLSLIVVLSIAVSGFAQVKSVSRNSAKKDFAKVQKFQGNETLDFVANDNSSVVRGEGELDYTYYDWQSNAGARTWTHVWNDGTVSFAFTQASNATFSDRGTAIGTYDSNNDEWIPSYGRIENEKTGFGSIAQYGANGIVVAAHTASDLGIYIIEDKDNFIPGTIPASLYTGSATYTHPAVMTSGANRNIIHVLCAAMSTEVDGVYEPILYYRSSDGGQSWDKNGVTIPFLSAEYGLSWGTNSYYWMETTANNRLAFVINNDWSDCMVVYSDDNGETWNRKVFYKHPNILGDFTDGWFFYPRWTSCQWNSNGELQVLYEFNGSTGYAEEQSGSYYPALGGVCFWNETMPYRGDGSNVPAPGNTLNPGEPFIMDSSYMYTDIYASWWLWSDATHEMWPEYMGYLAALDEDGQPENPDDVTEFAIEDRSLHGSYNCGVCAMPVLCMVPGSDDMVAIWSAMDENNTDGTNFYFKLFASASVDGGLTWSPQIQLTANFMYSMTEFVYNQAVVVGNQLIIASQSDGQTGTFVQEDETEGDDCYYMGLTFDLTELWPDLFDGVEENTANTNVNVYPNPAQDVLNVTLSNNSEIVISNMVGQTVMTINGKAGNNTINVSSLNNGVYFVTAGNTTQKVVVK